MVYLLVSMVDYQCGTISQFFQLNQRERKRLALLKLSQVAFFQLVGLHIFTLLWYGEVWCDTIVTRVGSDKCGSKKCGRQQRQRLFRIKKRERVREWESERGTTYTFVTSILKKALESFPRIFKSFQEVSPNLPLVSF